MEREDGQWSSLNCQARLGDNRPDSLPQGWVLHVPSEVTFPCRDKKNCDGQAPAADRKYCWKTVRGTGVRGRPGGIEGSKGKRR